MPPSLYLGTSTRTTPRFGRVRSALQGIKSAIAKDKAGAALLAFSLWMLAMAFVAIAAVITHIVWCLKAGAWLYLIAGVIPFVSVVHGIMIWLGVA